MKMLENRIHSRKDAVVCFSSFIVQAMSDWKSSKSSSGRTTLTTKMKVEADKRREARQKDAAEQLAIERARMEEVKRE